jgi:hypothetical protein
MKAYIVFWVDGRMTMSIEEMAYRDPGAASEAARALGYVMCAQCKEAAGNVGPGTVNVWTQPADTGEQYQFTIDGLYVCDVFTKEIDID